MKKSLFFVVSILVLFVFQNVHSEESNILRLDPSNRRFILWRVYTQPPDSSGKVYVIIDSTLRVEDFHVKEKFLLTGKKNDINKLKPNTYYLVLTIAANSGMREEKYWLAFSNGILPDTPENRRFLDQKWNEAKVIYTDKGHKSPRLKSREERNKSRLTE